MNGEKTLVAKASANRSCVLPAIYLVGPMGSGKTTVGRLLAKRLQRNFIDCDHYIIEQTGVAISWIFEKEGESGFRQRETKALTALTVMPNIVMATGGGVVESPSNYVLLARGLVIYLDASVDVQFSRTKRDKNRPLLQQDNPKAVLEFLYKKRGPLYRQVANVVIKTGGLSPSQMVDAILQRLLQLPARPPSFSNFGRHESLKRAINVNNKPTPPSPNLADSHLEKFAPSAQMLTLEVLTQTHCYPIIISSCAAPLELSLADYVSGQVLVVSNHTVAPLYLSKLLAKLQHVQSVVCILSDGEQYKTQDSINRIYDVLLQNHFGRDCTLIALGGGVIGDMTGFAAASFMRGVNFIQVPTTLLAQVDSSVGGKTGINHPLGKNMIGAFWQPLCVLADVATLATLPKREFASGMAEVIKYGCIMDEGFLHWLGDHHDVINDPSHSQHQKIVAQMVYRCCQYKAEIVGRDETEQGVRAYLNFGHTFAHAIETHMGYGNWLHGEAVAVGMVLAAKLSWRCGMIDAKAYAYLTDLLHLFALPTAVPAVSGTDLLALMAHDKKVKNGKMRFVLLQKIGQAVISDSVQPEQVLGVLADFDQCKESLN